MKCLIIDAVHSAIAEELGKYMQVDTHMLPTQEELVKLTAGTLHNISHSAPAYPFCTAQILGITFLYLLKLHDPYPWIAFPRVAAFGVDGVPELPK